MASMVKFRVLFLLSSYNGARYIEEQIESILNQIDIDIHIVIRDDGSTDNTQTLISAKYGNNKKITIIKGQNLGFKKSFSELVRYAYEKRNFYDFFAFADQDDIWYRDKTINSCRILANYDDSMPNLCTTNSMMIDSKGTNLVLFRLSDPNYTKYNFFFTTNFQGCSMTFNKKAIELYNCFPPENECHDQWMFYMCALLGHICHIHSPQFSYRIHNNNAIGSAVIMTFRDKLVRSFNFWLHSNNDECQKIVKKISCHYIEYIDDEYKKYLNNYICYRKSTICKFRLMFDKRSYTDSKGKTRMLWFWRNLLFNKF